MNETTEKDLEMINRYTRIPLGKEDVYTFPLVLCDNDVDRDGESFSEKAIDALAVMLEGTAGLFDHRWSARGQSARLYTLSKETVPGRTNSDGEPYCRLTGRAYMIRTQENEALIREIDAGIKKEVSLSCSVKKRLCSVCGGEMPCDEHEAGKMYGGRLCHAVLDEPTDAYEWSFVAVPAQKSAMVTKKLSSPADEAQSLREELERVNAELEKAKNAEKSYREELSGAIRASLRELIGDGEAVFLDVIKRADTKELDLMRGLLAAEVTKRTPPRPQLARRTAAAAKGETYGEYRI